MRNASPLLLLLPLLLASCDLALDDTRDPKYAAAIGHPVTSKITLYLYKPVDDRAYYLNELNSGIGVVAEIPPGQPILFNKVVRVTNADVEKHYLYGAMDFRGKTYPVCFLVDNWDNNEADVRQTLYYAFGIPK